MFSHCDKIPETNNLKDKVSVRGQLGPLHEARQKHPGASAWHRKTAQLMVARKQKGRTYPGKLPLSFTFDPLEGATSQLNGSAHFQGRSPPTAHCPTYQSSLEPPSNTLRSMLCYVLGVSQPNPVDNQD